MNLTIGIFTSGFLAFTSLTSTNQQNFDANALLSKCIVSNRIAESKNLRPINYNSFYTDNTQYKYNMDDEELCGTYIQEVNLEFVLYYKSTVWLKEKNKFTREVILAGFKNDTFTGKWYVVDSFLILSPNNLKDVLDTVKIVKDGLLFGEVGLHKKGL